MRRIASKSGGGPGPELGHAWTRYRDQYRDCRLCPRACGVDRIAGRRGVCGETAVCRIGAVCPHFGEEPSISGRCGSGTVFLAGCSTRCFFCQNYRISREGQGRSVSPEELLAAVEELVRKSVHNLNLVTPDHFWPHMKWLCERIRARGFSLPFVFNCSGYMAECVVRQAVEIIDIFLPDVKFMDPVLAARCMGDSRYPELALAALRRMVGAVGFLRPWRPDGRRTGRRGVLVRHLVLPDHVDNSLLVLRRLHEEFGPGLPLSVMSQYHPTPECRRRGLLNRRLAASEYERVVAEVEELGFEKVYIQPDFGDPDYRPDFDASDPFPAPRSTS
ncbi:MAG: radical SAM protein [Kiritimatiellaeota bacterium]|nr:radical SAM protein [Kiritimatiellota bacterium]